MSDFRNFLATYFRELRQGEVRGSPLPRTPVNKGKKKDQGCQILAQDGTQLLLQTSLVYVHPAFGYLVFANAEEAHPGKRHVSASWCDAHELTLVGTATPPAHYHLVSFGHYVLHSILDVWKGGAVNADVVLELFDAPLLLAGQMVDELSAKYLVCRIEIPSAEKVLEPASRERLVLFGHLFLRFARRPPIRALVQRVAHGVGWTHFLLANFGERRKAEVRRIPLPRTRLNRDNKKEAATTPQPPYS